MNAQNGSGNAENQQSNARGEQEKYVTMTVSGQYGSIFYANSWYDAQEQAEKSGYKVQDWTEHSGENVLVVAELQPR